MVSATAATYDANGLTTAATLGGDYTVTGNLTHTGTKATINKAVQINSSNSTSGSPGALSFHLNSNNDLDAKAHILFMGAGQNYGGQDAEYIFARDASTSSVDASDKYFTLTAPRGNSAGVKTTFNNAIEVPAPTADLHPTTRKYLHDLLATALNSSSDYASFKTNLLAVL